MKYTPSSALLAAAKAIHVMDGEISGQSRPWDPELEENWVLIETARRAIEAYLREVLALSEQAEERLKS